MALMAAAVAGCDSDGTPTAATSATPASASNGPESSPAGQPVGTAVMKVTGSGQATIRYRINGGDEQTEADVALPWERQYPVYDKLESSVTAESGGASLMCSIMMGDQLVAYKNEPGATCEFAYWG